ncbi:MurR/RpiR family transcriptional regulator [Roseibium aggregatum]|uniref:MurR/RpiR family transcriptional regulator n=1 Tax=Roseibium aggregatum TaxID=187304 RepID=A0A939EA11_9HYPH|nr:MurR/RpiR family transcriptional regulator [Roseibium aggregatum]MBN9668812.1 MurR/RpiR family transcriptional regulator [Roseibium aggregatum]
MTNEIEMDLDTASPLERRIHEFYAALPPAERKLADLVLQFPGDLAAYSATELSELAGVSKAAVTRFFKRIGFASFDEARRQSREARDRGSPIYLATSAQSGTVGPVDPGTFFNDEIQALQRTLHKLDAAAVARVCTRIAGARRIVVIGHRNSYHLAGYLRGLLGQIRPNVLLFPGPGETPGDHLADLGAEDLVIVVAMRRRRAQISNIMKSVADLGVPIVLITDPTARGLPALAKETLVCETASGFLFDTYTPAHAVLRLLAVDLSRQLGQKGRTHLKAIERLHEQLNELEQ